MKIERVKTKQDLRHFYAIGREVYKGTLLHRSTEDDVMHLLIEGPSAFHNHASINPYLLREDDRIVGRFALVHDQRLADYVQVAFFEALANLPDPIDPIHKQAQTLHPSCKRIVIGLNGHLNYGTGLLASRFDKAPVFGLPYTPPYYQNYFKNLRKRAMVSFRYTVQEFVEYKKKVINTIDLAGITVRNMNKKKLRQETELYTYLNNACFGEHPYWAERDVEEDYELFHPFRLLLKEENLVFAEKDGHPIGFLLWYPDFNQLVKGDQSLGLWQLLYFHLANPIDTFRFTEIGVLPQYRQSPAVLAMILHITPSIQKAGYKYGEGGFIFEENRSSIVMTRRFLQRAFGRKIEPYRQYCVFECELWP
jgi:hypothetical protein